MRSSLDAGALDPGHRFDEALATLAEVEWRLRNTWARAALLADQTDWRTPSARPFHDRVGAWRDDLARLCGAADDARDRLVGARHLARALPGGAV